MTTTQTILATAVEPTYPGPKPRLLFFRVLGDPDLPGFVQGHFREQVRCLEQFFDVTVVTENADYDEVVDRVRPDLALFESGVYARGGRSIVNTHKHPDVPKLGFLHSDGYCLSRSVFLADMDDWGVDTYFAYAMSAVGYTPDIADRTYLWPNFADRSVFHTYPEGKTETILLSGSSEPNYPWRVRVHALLAERFPSRSIAHGGWFDAAAAAAMPVGADYARSLSSALIVPTCGTISEEFVRKYIEIPAAGAVLLAERTPIAEAAGFVDMQTCVFADESDVVDKVEYLLDNPEVLQRIAAAGQELAHSRHSIEHRDQIRQWYELHRSAAPGQRIIQPDPFGKMVLSGTAKEGQAVSVALPTGRDRILIAGAEERLISGRPAAAAEAFAQTLNLHYEPEAALGLARSWITMGKPEWARDLLEHATDVGVSAHGASHPDPVEWAWLVRASICEGDLPRSAELAGVHTGIRHPELDRIRAVVGALSGLHPSLAPRSRHRSVHVVESVGWGRWTQDLANDLRASGQDELAHTVCALPEPGGAPVPTTAPQTTLRSRTLASTRRLAHRVLGRVRWEITRRRASPSAPDRASLFQLLGGLHVDTAVLLLVEDEVAQHFEPYVLRSPDPVSMVRIGRSAPVLSEQGFSPLGLRWGADARLVRQIVEWGSSVVVASSIGFEILEPEDLESAAILVLLADADSARWHPASSGWQRVGDDLDAGFGRALGIDGVRVWRRAITHEADRHG